MPDHSAIKHFVRHTLGCTCPDEVFETIQYDAAAANGGLSRLLIGNRLLIHILPASQDADVAEVLKQAITRGVQERDQQGFNRFRLVLVTDHAATMRAQDERIFTTLIAHDDKTHLHLVGVDAVVGILEHRTDPG